MKDRITKRLVDSLEPIEGKRLRVYDDQLVGFGVAVQPTGKKGFFIEYGPADHRRRMVLGNYGALTVDAARKRAALELAKVVDGVDPMVARQERRNMPTVGDWITEHLEGVRRRKKQPRHDERYLGMASDRWRARPLDQITRRDVQAAMEATAESGHTTANRWLASVRACFQAALRDGVIKENPAMGVKPFREAPPRARVLSDDEFGRVVEAFDGLADPFVRAAFVLLMDTGARKSEVLSARWEDFDLDGGLWRIPSPKAGRPQTIPLSAGTVTYLRTVDRVGPWFAPGRDVAEHRTDLKRGWEAVRKAATLDGVTIHDLRRTFGLHVARRAGLHIASKLLRHSDIRVTERVYAPLGMDDLRSAVADMQGQRGKVIELRGKGLP